MGAAFCCFAAPSSIDGEAQQSVGGGMAVMNPADFDPTGQHPSSAAPPILNAEDMMFLNFQVSSRVFAFFSSRSLSHPMFDDYNLCDDYNQSSLDAVAASLSLTHQLVSSRCTTHSMWSIQCSLVVLDLLAIPRSPTFLLQN